MSGMQMPPAQAPAADPHAGHNMGQTPAADPHAGHDMSAMTGGPPNIPTSVDAIGGRMVETPPPAAAENRIRLCEGGTSKATSAALMLTLTA